MREKKVGLYLGVNSVGAVMAQGRDLISLGRFEFSSLEATKGGVLDEDVRWEALINKTLRELGSDIKDIYISVADKDFIFRLLEMPIMKKKEVESSLVYEVEKYIPFKMKELVWDYEYVSFSKEKKINLSFVGIKENNFQRIKSILSRLELNAVVLEPSCISLVRVVKALKKFSPLKNFAILDFSQSEAYLTFFQRDLPVFNRYLVVSKKEGTFDLDSFIEAVNFSFQYFKREFKNYELEKFIIAGDSGLEELAPLLKEGLQVEIETISSCDLIARDNARIENVKALGVVGAESFSYKFKPELRSTEERISPSQGVPSESRLKVGLLGTLAGIGLVVSVFFSVMLGYKIPEKRAILKQREKAIVIPAALEGLSSQERMERVNLEEERINSLRKVVASFNRLSPFFKELASDKILPRRLWLNKLGVYQKNYKYTAVLSGYIFCNDDYQERLGVDEFISNLKKNKVVRPVFSRIELESSSRKKIEDFEVTYFAITLEK